MPLPDQRFTVPPSQLVTALLASLTASTPASKEVVRGSATGNISQASRPCLLTLHLLFPHALLDALDLLDRGLVTKLLADSERNVEHTNQSRDTQRGSSSTAGASDVYPVDFRTDDSGPSHARAESKRGNQPMKFFYVQSAQPLSRQQRFQRSTPRSIQDTSGHREHQPTQSYQIHLDAWNCSCPGFAYAAFSSNVATSGFTSYLDQELYSTLKILDEDNGRYVRGLRHSHQTAHPRLNSSTHFGGVVEALRIGKMSSTNLAQTNNPLLLPQESMPPICKHILACTLAEACPELFPVITLRETEPSSTQPGVVEHWGSMEEAAGWGAGWVLG